MLKSQITLLHKELVAPQTFLLTFSCPNSVDFTAGQFANFEIEPKVWRSYSFVDCSNQIPGFLESNLALWQEKFPSISFENVNYWSFLVSSKSGGVASQLFDKIELGFEISTLAPVGRFAVLETSKDKVFVCTGTGLAPFIPMIRNALLNSKCTLFFGTSWDATDYGRILCERFGLFENPNFVMYSGMFPIETPNVSEFVQNGTVTQLLPKYLSDFESKEFYLCGNPFMVLDVEKLILEMGGKTIIKENFGVIKK